MSPMDADVERLAEALDELAAFLADHSESSWAEWTSKDAAWTRRGDGYGVTHFLSAFGGMGSLDDVVFDPRNGNAASMAEAEGLNQAFDELRGRAWRLASALRHAAQD